MAPPPVWGFPGALGVGLWPTPGPRGLFRLYAPYLDQPFPRMINYLSVEPVVKGWRCQSELERSADGQPGKAFDVVAEHHTDDRITVTVRIERFANGAQPELTLTLLRERPREVTITVGAVDTSAAMDACILSATMGNYARLRLLRLKDRTVAAKTLWPTSTPDRLNFEPWRQWDTTQLVQREGQVVLEARSDEPDPTTATYAPAIPPHWRYEGKAAVQTWRTKRVPGVVARANARRTYWGEHGPIPGGVAFENIELEAPYRAGQSFTYSVEALFVRPSTTCLGAKGR